ncbi:unnamed protein product [Tilletia caries]|uniref:AAA+ ATPase domain-containing protein n=1 Tax=Tilletia caries TaxID=13290 RepID=A0ABN7IPP4_9BASI|nr:unnamed protein product [Tilletia caries]
MASRVFAPWFCLEDPDMRTTAVGAPREIRQWVYAILPLAKPVGVDQQIDKLLFGLLKPLQGNGMFRTLAAPSGALLYGPPGTGKTLLVQQAAFKARINCVRLKASDIHSKFIGISEKILSNAFEEAKLAAPSIIVIDEIDCIFPSRGSVAGEKNPSVLAQILTEMDNVRGQRVAIVATTNVKDRLDPALLRRLPLKIEVPLPSLPAREALLLHHMGSIKNSLKDKQISQLAALTEGCSCSDITAMVELAQFQSIHQVMTKVLPKGKSRPKRLPAVNFRHFTLPTSRTIMSQTSLSIRLPTPLQNEGSSTTHKGTLKVVLQPSPRRRSKLLSKIRAWTLAAHQVQYIASWFACYIVEAEHRHPSKLKALQRAGTYADSIDVLSDTSGTRGGSGLGILFEECMYYANSGNVRSSKGKRPPDGTKRLVCKELVATHAAEFHALWPFVPNNAEVHRTVLIAFAAQWTSAVITQIQEHLMNALAHIVNKVADIKKAQAHRLDADPGVVAASKNRLAAIRQYKAWLFEHTENLAPPDLTDAAIAKVHGKILPLLEQLPRSDRKRLDRDLERNPLRYLRFFLSALRFFAEDPVFCAAHPPIRFPTAHRLVPKHILLDAAALSHLSASIQYVGPQPQSTALALYGKSKEQLKTEAWDFVFDLTKLPFGSTTRWILDASVRTDGVAISVHKRTNSKKLSKSEAKARRFVSSRGSAAKARANAKVLQARGDFPELETLTDEEVRNAMGRAVFIDPGKRNLLTAVGEHSKSKKHGAIVLRYSAAQRAASLGTAMFKKRLTKRELRMDPSLSEVIASLSRLNSRAFSASAISAWLQSMASHFDRLANVYGDLFYRQVLLRKYSMQQIETTKLIKNFSQKFGSDAILIFGTWNQTSIRKQPSTLKASTLQKAFSKAGFTVYSVDEYLTSSCCPFCFGRVTSSSSTIQLRRKDGFDLMDSWRIRGLPFLCDER